MFLNGEHIKCLLYADDLVLFSTSAQGLQHQLDRLYEYCRTWLLTVNVSKTECMFVKHRKHPSTQPPPLFYGGCALSYVDTFKYVGAFFSDDGSFSIHEKKVIERSTRAMFACISRIGRVSKNCPLYIKSLVFKAYVLPVMTYGCEAIAYTKKTIKALDDIILRYCRWAIGVPKFSNRVLTLRECGMRLVSHTIRAAQVKYYLQLQARPPHHLTTHALLHVIASPFASNGMRLRWLSPIVAVLTKWNLFFDYGLPSSPSFCNMYEACKTQLTSAVSLSGDFDWEVEVTSQADVSIHADVSSINHVPLFDGPTVSTASDLSLTLGYAHNILCSPFCIAYSIMNNSNQSCLSRRSRCVAPYGNSCLSARASRALALFRLGCAPLRRNTAFGEKVHMRTCFFCYHVYGVRFVEDEYHVCFQCPLYEQPRYLLLCHLRNADFSFNNTDPYPLNLLASLLSVSIPHHVRIVGKFLCECLAMRALAGCGALQSSTPSTVAGTWLSHVTSQERAKLQMFVDDAFSQIE